MNVRTRVAAGILLGGILWVSINGAGPLPPVGPLLDPALGMWAAARGAEIPEDAAAVVPNLRDTVRVIYDDRNVPHIFAATVEDATRALGYVVARHRTFQLDLQTRATAGTLTELFGPDALEADRGSRQLGLAWSAERLWRNMTDRNDAMVASLRAYSDGVNAWLDAMGPPDVPLEYHLIGARPAAWEPQHSLYLVRNMGWTLTYFNTERRKAAAAARVGWDAAHALFPVANPIQEPIQPTGRDEASVTFDGLPPPGAPDSAAGQLALALERLPGPTPPEDAALASNNWAAGPLRTADDVALLAGDPHLNLTLPSIWYEAHLVVPDSLDVYGVTIPGLPGIIIGFNRDVAWTFTNTEADVLDFYRETMDDAEQPSQYRLDGQFNPLIPRIEVYRNRRGAVIATDTILHTHRGPVMRAGDQWHSLRWTVLESDGELGAFHNIARARTVDEWLAAMTTYEAPAQNGLVADRLGSIAIRSSGWYPIRPAGRGDTVFDGSTSASDWRGLWPVSRYPFAVDPGQGFLASANQQPIDPRADAGYLGADWPPPWRAMRINQLLRSSRTITARDFREFQTDPGSARADWFVPYFLSAADRVLEESPDELLSRARQLLGEWNRQYTKDNNRAVLFEAALMEFAIRTWDELSDAEGAGPRPGSSMLAVMLQDSSAIWWDVLATPDRETRDDVLTASLRAGLENARADHGPEDGEGWRWRNVQHANIYHLMFLPPLSALNLPVQGGPSTISPSSGRGTHGASWRMVVRLGEEVTAWGTYPGGQSGSPLSAAYRDRISGWVDGELESLRFARSIEELDGVTRARLVLVPAQ